MKTVLFLLLTCCCLQSMAQQATVPANIKKQGARNSALKFVAPDSSFHSVKSLSLNTAYYNHLGFMCRQEVKMEKATKMALRLRLGSVSYTDRMEGKLHSVTAR